MHPVHPLIIVNYTEKTQYGKKWDEITSVCRGLITNTSGKIIARSFKKFHNIEENLHEPTPEFEIFDKLDGSLGILFNYEDEWIISSRGSFTSEQSVHATSLLKQKYSTDPLDKDKSYIFEIIYPTNRIVVDYGDRDELVYLASFEKNGKESFEEDAVREAGFPVVTRYPNTDYSTFKRLDWDNSEGAVVRFSNGDRTKIKFENYLRLHKIVTNLNVTMVWEWFATGQPMEDFVERVPDEYFKWLKDSWTDLDDKYKELQKRVFEEFDRINSKVGSKNRRDFAMAVKDHPDKSMMFSLLDDKDIRPLICSRIRPVGVQKFAQIGQTSTKQRAETIPKKGRLIILSGISASGKSSWAKTYVESHADSVVVGRDGIRSLLFCANNQRYYDHFRLSFREEFVTDIQHEMIRASVDAGKTVIVDDTNLTTTIINQFLKKYLRYDIEFKTFECDMADAIARDRRRERVVGPQTIMRQNEKWLTLKKAFDFESRSALDPLPIIADDSLPKAFVFDVDGTLAQNNGRNPYEWSRVKEDTVRSMVRSCLWSLQKDNYKVLICSGRDSCCLDLTKQWLADNSITFDDLRMRSEGDQRPDWVIKEDIWRDLAKSYDIIALFDDRQQVVDHGRALGLEIFQVAEGNF